VGAVMPAAYAPVVHGNGATAAAAAACCPASRSAVLLPYEVRWMTHCRHRLPLHAAHPHHTRVNDIHIVIYRCTRGFACVQYLGVEHAVAERDHADAPRLQHAINLRKHALRLLQVLHAAEGAQKR
jgi:hypothetical protein